jgi:magnesium transporter
MEPDDATDVVEMLPDELRRRVISDINNTEEVELANLLAYPPETAGGIMSPLVFKLSEDHSCGDAIAELQAHAEELESVFYLYVVDVRDRLTGIVSLRSLLVHPPTTPLVSIMHRDVIAVGPLQDQEEVARFVARYDLLAVPVVDEERRLLGIVTVDDVVDVIRDEAAEDMMLMAGVPEEADVIRAAPARLARMRASWLMATLVGGVVASELVTYYDGLGKELVLLAAFLPVVMGMGGNVGTQSATIAVRGLATGHLEIGGAWTFLWRELRVGLMLGAGFGAVLGVYSLARHWPSVTQGSLVAISLPISLTLASLWGAGVPLAMSRAGVDPAIATGPVVATTLDVVGILVYFNVAILVLQALS